MTKKRVLVVDNHQPTRSQIRSMLQADPADTFEILEAGTGTEGLMAAESDGPLDLILLDVEMQDMDGYTICRAIRKVNNKVPIVFVSAHGELKDRSSGRKAGGDSFLVKPLRQAPLMTLVNLLTSTEMRRPRVRARA